MGGIQERREKLGSNFALTNKSQTEQILAVQAS